MPGGRKTNLFKAALKEPLKEPLMGLCARYLALERGPTGRALDPVARFHLRNGAQIERINWLGGTSEKGLAQIEENHEDYVGEGKVAIGSQVKSLLGAQAKLRKAAGEWGRRAIPSHCGWAAFPHRSKL